MLASLHRGHIVLASEKANVLNAREPLRLSSQTYVRGKRGNCGTTSHTGGCEPVPAPSIARVIVYK